MTSAGDGPVASKVLIVDISDFENRKHEIAEQLHSAAKDVGFFYIKGHGISTERVEAAFSAGQSFYDLPDDREAGTSSGYLTDISAGAPRRTSPQ